MALAFLSWGDGSRAGRAHSWRRGPRLAVLLGGGAASAGCSGCRARITRRSRAAEAGLRGCAAAPRAVAEIRVSGAALPGLVRARRGREREAPTSQSRRRVGPATDRSPPRPGFFLLNNGLRESAVARGGARSRLRRARRAGGAALRWRLASGSTAPARSTAPGKVPAAASAERRRRAAAVDAGARLTRFSRTPATAPVAFLVSPTGGEHRIRVLMDRRGAAPAAARAPGGEPWHERASRGGCDPAKLRGSRAGCTTGRGSGCRRCWSGPPAASGAHRGGDSALHGFPFSAVRPGGGTLWGLPITQAFLASARAWTGRAAGPALLAVVSVVPEQGLPPRAARGSTLEALLRSERVPPAMTRRRAAPPRAYADGAIPRRGSSTGLPRH